MIPADIARLAFLLAIALAKRNKPLAWKEAAVANWHSIAKWFNADPATRRGLEDQMELVEDVVGQLQHSKEHPITPERIENVIRSDEFQALKEETEGCIHERIKDDPSALSEKNPNVLMNAFIAVLKNVTLEPTVDQLFTSLCRVGGPQVENASGRAVRRQEESLRLLKKKRQELIAREKANGRAREELEKKQEDLEKREAEIAAAGERDAELEERLQSLVADRVRLMQLEAENSKLQEELEALKASAGVSACAVCQCHDNVGALVECGHRFCKSCITRWFSSRNHNGERNSSCPSCRVLVVQSGKWFVENVF